MRLTKRGWNNVLIFATLFMIVLFNSTHQKFVEGDNSIEKASLIPADAIIQVIDYSGVKFERIGSNWRTQSAVTGVEELNAEQIVTNWQSLPLERLANSPEISANSYSLPVLVQAIGLDSQQIFIIHVDVGAGLVYLHNKVNGNWYLSSLNELPLFVPSVLLKEE